MFLKKFVFEERYCFGGNSHFITLIVTSLKWHDWACWIFNFPFDRYSRHCFINSMSLNEMTLSWMLNWRFWTTYVAICVVSVFNVFFPQCIKTPVLRHD
jgi:magnesium-transporting ATPase (P-type)